MGSFDLLDTILNVCRTPADVLHIIAYQLFVLIIVLICWRLGNAQDFNKYIYYPLCQKWERLGMLYTGIKIAVWTWTQPYSEPKTKITGTRRTYRNRRK